MHSPEGEKDINPIPTMEGYILLITMIVYHVTKLRGNRILSNSIYESKPCCNKPRDLLVHTTTYSRVTSLEQLSVAEFSGE